MPRRCRSCSRPCPPSGTRVPPIRPRGTRITTSATHCCNSAGAPRHSPTCRGRSPWNPSASRSRTRSRRSSSAWERTSRVTTEMGTATTTASTRAGTRKGTTRLARMRILVTGAAGFIGSNFVRHLRETRPGDHVVAYDLLTYAGVRENVPDDVPFVEADIADLELAERTLAEHEIEVVVNFAAESH